MFGSKWYIQGILSSICQHFHNTLNNSLLQQIFLKNEDLKINNTVAQIVTKTVGDLLWNGQAYLCVGFEILIGQS